MVPTNVPVAPGMQSIRTHPVARALVLTTIFAVLTAWGSQVAFRLPFTPVPVTLQVFFVLLSGAVLGRTLGALSQVQYLALGASGLPVFAGGATGLTAFAGPTAGYLIGFVAAAWLVGALTERLRRPSDVKVFLALLAGLWALYLPGTLWLALWLRVTGAGSDALLNAARLGIAPFVLADVAKALLAAGIATCQRRA